MIITTRRSSARYLLDVVLTALGWIFFIYLFAAGIFAILSGEMQGPQAPLVPPELLSSAQTVINYAVIALINANVLVGWAVYNQFRFAGKDRRKPPKPLTEKQLQKSFSLSPVLFSEVQNAGVMVVYHEEESSLVCTIDILKGITSAQDNAASLRDIPQTAKQKTLEAI